MKLEAELSRIIQHPASSLSLITGLFLEDINGDSWLYYKQKVPHLD